MLITYHREDTQEQAVRYAHGEIGVKPHFHDDWQLTHVRRGWLQMEIAGRRVKVLTGQTIAIAPNCPHFVASADQCEQSNRYVARTAIQSEDFAHCIAVYRSSVNIQTLVQEKSAQLPQVIRRVHRIYGITPYAVKIGLRLNRARQMLREGQAVAGVAVDCGFTDQSHLTRQFRQTFGITPARYAALWRPNLSILF